MAKILAALLLLATFSKPSPHSSQSLIINGRGDALQDLFDDLHAGSIVFFANPRPAEPCKSLNPGVPPVKLRPIALSRAIGITKSTIAMQTGCYDHWEVFTHAACSYAGCNALYAYEDPTVSPQCDYGHWYDPGGADCGNGNVCDTQHACTNPCSSNTDSYQCGMTYDQWLATVEQCHENGMEYQNEPTCMCGDTPIVFDLSGKGYSLTSAENGVKFRLLPGKGPVQTAWTKGETEQAFLFLDRNGNGIVDDSTELFGNNTSQPASNSKNGFAALAEFDKPENGGNGDGVIDGRDAVFSKLRLWVDRNHNGQSEPDEISDLPSKGIFSISLDYRENKKHDQYGNLFRYRARINVDSSAGERKFAYDVIFLTSNQGK